MKNKVYLFSLFLFIGSSFTYTSIHQYPQTAGSSLSLAVETKQPKTSTSNDGSIELSISGGAAPYTVQVSSTASPSEVYHESRVVLKKISAGTYMILIQDAQKNILHRTIELTPVQ